MEAHDKKQLDEATRNEPKGMQAIVGICTFIVRFAWGSTIVQVPDQPNFCDCGIYLLHFARTFMKDPKLSSDIIRVCVANCTMWDLAQLTPSTQRSSPPKGRRGPPHEHWDGASVGRYRDELAARINSMSAEWKRQRSEHDSGTKNETEAGGSGSAAPQEQQQEQQPQPQQQQQPRGGDPTPATSSKADNDSDSDIEVLCSPQKPKPSKASRKDSGLSEPRRKAARLRG
jgi:Ulp1 protease family, C-terminal catalytic domain